MKLEDLERANELKMEISNREELLSNIKRLREYVDSPYGVSLKLGSGSLPPYWGVTLNSQSGNLLDYNLVLSVVCKVEGGLGLQLETLLSEFSEL